jgi:DNA-binding NarL/FixJ family response regulator
VEWIDVFIAEDHTLVREGTRQILEQQPDLHVVGEADRGDLAVERLARLHPHVAVLDFRLPVLNGVEVTARVHAAQPDVKVLLLSAYDDAEYILAALQAGAAGYLLKTVPGHELVAAIRAVYAGETVLQDAVSRVLAAHWRRASLAAGSAQLSAREREVLGLLAAGLANKEIARRLSISLRTVEGHLGNVFGKLGVGSRTEAVLYALEHRLLVGTGRMLP